VIGDQPANPRALDFNVLTDKEVLGTITDSSGQAWVLPSYALYGDGGVANQTDALAGVVLAVQDGLIDLPTMPAGVGVVRY